MALSSASLEGKAWQAYRIKGGGILIQTAEYEMAIRPDGELEVYRVEASHG